MTEDKRYYENDREELEFYREYRNKSNWEISDEINTLLGLDDKGNFRKLYLAQLGKKDLILLKNSIKKKLKEKKK